MKLLFRIAVICTLGLVYFNHIHAQQLPKSRIQTIQTMDDLTEVTSGVLLTKKVSNTLRHGYEILPLLDTQITLTITGLVARAQVKQFFQNQSRNYIEAMYLFPLPEQSAVDHLMMTIGERQIIGEIKEKSQARKIYNQAKRSGKKAALLEQQRANLFKSTVANIAPGEVVEITIEYQQTVDYDNGEYSIRFPTAITPRYQPIEHLIKEQFSSTPNPMSFQVPVQVLNDEAAISFSMDIELDAGVELSTIQSTYHNIVRRKVAKGRYSISLEDYEVSDRDFELRWSAVTADTARLSSFVEQDSTTEDQYVLLMLMPPEVVDFKPLPREITLIVDTSGSMEGSSMDQAILALKQVLNQLGKQDRFNIISFSDEPHSLYKNPVVVTKQSIRRAQRFVGNLKAEGGTEMYSALEAALNEPVSKNYVRQVVFLTDGAVSNESELFELIQSSLGSARLFTIGIGSAPNSYFMKKSAQFGRGSFTYIGRPEEVSEKMQQLFTKLENPSMRNIEVSWPFAVEQYPQLIPDLYKGEPLLIKAKINAEDLKRFGEVQISGYSGQSLWQASVPVQRFNRKSKSVNSLGLSVLWARSKISDLLDQQIETPQDTALKQKVINVALSHHLVSPYTSLVAVEQKTTAPADAHLKSMSVQNHLPAGSNAQVFGYPMTATGWHYQWYLGFISLLLAGAILLAQKINR